MEREKKNPYVTKVDLDQNNHEIRKEINNVRNEIVKVDRKHDEKHFERDRSLIVLSESMRSFSESMKDVAEEIKGMRKEFREAENDRRQTDKDMRESHGKMERTLIEHDYIITSQQKFLDNKKVLNGKWIAGGLSVLGVFIGSLFGIADTVVNFFLEVFWNK